MKLQLALDCGTLADAASILESTADMVDIAEVGTPLVLREGASAIWMLKEQFPKLLILADFKIMDAGAEEAAIAFDAGADIVTVLAAAETVTIQRACDAAIAAGRQVMADLIAVADPARRAVQIAALGVHLLCCHTAFDMQSSGAEPTGALAELRAALPDARLAVAGGINPQRIGLLTPFAPEVVIVGGFVTRAADPRAAVEEVRKAMH